jgi:cytidine deaminase
MWSDSMNKDDLIKQAKIAWQSAYTPYSKFNVGCALLLRDGNVILGANIENASYGLTNCAERSALFSAYSQGYRREDIVKMAVVGDTDSFISPCGACRQVILELVGDETEIYLSNFSGTTKQLTKHELLPFGFTSQDME